MNVNFVSSISSKKPLLVLLLLDDFFWRNMTGCFFTWVGRAEGAKFWVLSFVSFDFKSFNTEKSPLRGLQNPRKTEGLGCWQGLGKIRDPSGRGQSVTVT